MDQLILGGRVRVVSPRSSLNCRVGRIIRVTQPFVANEQMKAEALAQMPLYKVEFDDGHEERCRGRDLELLQGTALPDVVQAENPGDSGVKSRE